MSEQTRDEKHGWNASWIERRYVTGVVYATSKTDAAKRIRNGEGLAIDPGKSQCSSPAIHGQRSLRGPGSGIATSMAGGDEVTDHIPSDDLMQRVEDGTYLETCDWGYCNRQTEAFAQSDSDSSGDWLPVCAPCARGEFPEANTEPYPVNRVIWLNIIEEALGR